VTRILPFRGAVRVGLAMAVAFLVALAVVVVGPRLLPDLDPFATETLDRSQPALLQSLQRIDEYRAARANLQQIVDVEKDAKLLPSFIKGERTVMVAAGDVDATVDFRTIGPKAVRISPDGTGVVITLPAARLSRARLDLNRTRVVDHDRGLLDRAGEAVSDGGADDQRELLAQAQRKLDVAARADRDLLPTAERNTAQMLRRLARALGYERVTVRFKKPPVV
jgi:hypothetical protein